MIWLANFKWPNKTSFSALGEQRCVAFIDKNIPLIGGDLKKVLTFIFDNNPPPPQSSHNKKGTTEDNSLIFGHKTEQISDKTLSLLN